MGNLFSDVHIHIMTGEENKPKGHKKKTEDILILGLKTRSRQGVIWRTRNSLRYCIVRDRKRIS